MPQQLATRIAVMFALWAIVLVAIYTLIFMVLTRSAEDRLLTEVLGREANSFMAAADHGEHDWQPGSPFVRAGPEGPEVGELLPEGFDRTRPGFQSFTGEDGREYEAISMDPGVEGRSRLLILDATEARAAAGGVSDYVRFLTLIALAGLLATALVSFIVGRLAARPVEALTALISSRRESDPPARFAARFGRGEVGVLAGALETSLSRASEALARERLFNQGVSHELRSSLQVADHALELIGARAGAPPDPSTLDRLRRAMEQMRGASEAFLWLSRPEQRADEPVEVNLAVARAIAGLETAAQVRGAAILFEECEAVCLPIPGPVIEVIASNLVRNSLQHSGADTVHVALSMDGLRVRDQGRGLEPAQIEAINAGISPEGIEGVGLGLALCQRLCQRFGGSMTVSSDGPGRGMEALWRFA
tara:strand:+ start:6147 stop:7409 length:1263 start_codon:yes stop_codon:yes gene_type:complete